MKSYSITDVGQKRTVNQDFVFTSETPVGNLPNLFVSCGRHGRTQGRRFRFQLCGRGSALTIREDENSNPVKIIRAAIENANTQLLREASDNETMSGMGTTMVLVTIVGHYAYVANVGDSRLYLVDENKISQITKDHSLVEEMVRMGEISRDDARNHPDKNIITRALGAGRDVDLDFFDIRLTPGDILLLCSDGLSNMVPDEDIRQVIRTSETLEETGRRLVSMANDNGGRDNIAVVLVEPETKEVEVC
ncbi:MAG: Stp1/IreP family PP2C-type Ser/Thr phosphatase [Blautia sp.]